MVYLSACVEQVYILFIVLNVARSMQLWMGSFSKGAVLTHLINFEKYSRFEHCPYILKYNMLFQK